MGSRIRSRRQTGARWSRWHDAATYITGLPKKEAALPEWRAAIEALMLVVERNGQVMLARIGVMRALNRGDCRARLAEMRKQLLISPDRFPEAFCDAEGCRTA